MTAHDEFKRICAEEILSMGRNVDLLNATRNWMSVANKARYSYHFEWQGRPIIQYPQDVFALQELIWQVRPDLVIETGIAHGGSLIFSASMLALLDLHDAIAAGRRIDPRLSNRKVLGVDLDIRAHNRKAIETHPMASRIKMLEGSSTAPSTVRVVKDVADGYGCVLVCLDSNHTHDHVLAELEAYAPLTSIGSYCVVFDTIIDEFSEDSFPNRPWGPGNSPGSAVREFLKANPDFEVERSIEQKLMITVAAGGYLRRTR